jgi:hypothetical protein
MVLDTCAGADWSLVMVVDLVALLGGVIAPAVKQP